MEAIDVEAIKRLVAECTAEGRAALRGRDRAGYRIAVARRMAAKRRGGRLLLDGADASAVSGSSAQRWRHLARMIETDFRIAIERGHEDWRERHREPPAQIRMVQTEFRADERGNLHRQVYAVDDPAAARPPR